MQIEPDKKNQASNVNEAQDSSRSTGRINTKDDHIGLDGLRPSFSALPLDVQRAVIRCAKLLKFRDGEPLRGRENVKDWVVCSAGGLRIDLTSKGGNSRAFTRVRVGEWWGDIPIFMPETLQFDARAQGATQLLVVTHQDFLELLNAWPVLARAVLAAQTLQLTEIAKAYDDLRTLPLRVRLAQFLYQLDQESSSTLLLSERQKDIADQIHASRQRVNLELRKFRQAKLIAVGKAGIKVLDAVGLKSVSLQA